MKIFGKLWRYWRFFRESADLKSKMALVLYLPQTLIHIFDNSHRGRFIFDVTLRNENGIFFCGKSFVAVHTASSFHEKGMSAYFVNRSGTIVDVGANIGKYSVIAARNLKGQGKVVAIEAEPYNYSVIKKNIALNKLSNVTALNCACFSKPGKLDFYVEKEGGGLHSVYPTKDHSKKISVEGETLDNIVKKHKIEDISLIKVDVEQAEADVLLGARNTIRTQRPEIIFEAWDSSNLEKVSAVLLPLGYEIKKGLEMNYIAQYNSKKRKDSI